jgi:hypothetical protein
VWLGYDTYAPLVPAVTRQVPARSPYDAREIFYNSLDEMYLLVLSILLSQNLKNYIKSAKELLTLGLEFEGLVSRVSASFVKRLQDCNKYQGHVTSSTRQHACLPTLPKACWVRLGSKADTFSWEHVLEVFN